MARLTHELCERKRLRTELRKQQKEVRLTETQLEQKSSFLEQLHPNVVTQLRGLSALRGELQLDQMPVVSEAAYLLCTPLYTLYRQALASGHGAGDRSAILTEVSGDQVAAERALLRNEPNSPAAASASSAASLTEEQAYAEYPLSVHLQLPGGRAPFRMRFVYLPALEVVAVRCDARADEHSGPVRLPQLLSNLYPGDTGAETPNLANCRLVLSGGASAASAQSARSPQHGAADEEEDDLEDDEQEAAAAVRLFSYESARDARPYHWAQRVCGLCYPPPLSAASGSAVTGTATQFRGFAEWMSRLQQRIAAHEELASQLRTLSCGEMVAVPWRPSEARLVSFSPVSAIEFWKRLDGVKGRRQRSSLPGFAHSLHELGPNHWTMHGATFYSGSAMCGMQPLSLLVVITAEYPVRPALFCVSAPPPSNGGVAALPSYVGERSHPDALKAASSSDMRYSSFGQDLRELETEVNLHQTMLVLRHLADQGCDGKLLGYQVARLLLCFEALCKSRTQIREVAGRARSKTIWPRE
jgi:Fms-interacting protein/Thoc5